MEQLLQIKTTPIALEFKLNRAQYEVKTDQPSYNMTRNKGGLSIDFKPTKLKIDTIEARYSTGIKSAMRAVEDFASKGLQSALQATAEYAQEGNAMAAIDKDKNPVVSIAARKFISDIEFNLAFIPGRGADISWDPAELSMRYEMDKLNFDWRHNKPKVKYTPTNIEFIVKQYPNVEVIYVGDPQYIPPSADPNYKPIDVNV